MFEVLSGFLINEVTITGMSAYIVVHGERLNTVNHDMPISIRLLAKANMLTVTMLNFLITKSLQF